MSTARTRPSRTPAADRAPIRDHHQELTDRIIAALEQGVVPWRRSWNPDLAGGDAVPRNATTGRRYRGVNVLMLAMSPFAWSTGDNRWCSYRQAAERGWQVRKGETGTRIFFFKQRELVGADETGAVEGDDRVRRAPIMRAHTVFHLSQMDGAPPMAPRPAEPDWRCPEAVEIMVRNSGADVRHGGSQAFYSPSTDHIQMPPAACFEGPHAMAAVLAHELAHWSGAGHRLARDLSGRFGTEKYAQEELIAELASCFVGAELGLPCDIPNHASYVASWLRRLRDDKREIFRAAAAAQRAADYCLAFHPAYRADLVAADAAETDSDGEDAGSVAEPPPQLLAA